MARKRKLIKDVQIVDVAEDGKCVGRVEDGMVVFVKGVVPGDVVDVKITKKKKNYMEGQPVNFSKKSEIRVESFCEHFGTCGGCKWQHLEYSQQLVYKQKVVVDAMERIARVPIPETIPILPSKETKYYRNKLEFTFTSDRWLTTEEIMTEIVYERRGTGFHLPGRFDKVLDLNHCYLQKDPSNDIRVGLKEFAIKNDFDFFDLYKNEGFLRNLIIRTANTGDLMLILQFFVDDEEKIKKTLDYLIENFPQITSLNYVINSKVNDVISDLNIICAHGKPYIEEEMEGLKFRVGPKSFYQTNSEQAYELYKITRDFAKLSKEDVVYDLYTGTGTIALFVARDVKEVVGLEYVHGAIEDAKVNAETNGIENSRFYAGDIRYLLDEKFIKANKEPDVVITDPPRAGMHPDVIKTLLRTGAKRIVYVSCNPSTQARDIAMLNEKYELKRIQPVDMFPHTHHVENVALLEKR
ncbi:23S rRNA (uracil(1939)-C(5))-methyltransferase RlmD [Flammeovirgaceae bacterium SG7u.111]|nr:23S rRNA (uracil(1939)-C(5))-methyltransferase RlmD [Flammeovirgaceae bacterium SG7u.132]WPO33090.1 23S rRNA (uracil(1939)-C(5))-methyltransferase RlmD [Flammeovirgaceae bacterium SG7u.111]